MRKVYIETSVVSYYVADRSDNITVSAHQLATRRMWDILSLHKVYISDTVIEEASKGNPLLAEKRLMAMTEFSILPVNRNVKILADKFLEHQVIPEKCPEDGFAYSSCRY